MLTAILTKLFCSFSCWFCLSGLWIQC